MVIRYTGHIRLRTESALSTALTLALTVLRVVLTVRTEV
jgi:hypothetical protein